MCSLKNIEKLPHYYRIVNKYQAIAHPPRQAAPAAHLQRRADWTSRSPYESLAL
jgi:hypothetical protein